MPWGLNTRLAAAAGCQRPYLSKALKSEAQLLPSQLFGISKFLKLSAVETEYLMLLLEPERAGEKVYRDHIKNKLRKSKLENEQLSKRVAREEKIVEGGSFEYYSTWYWSAIHLLTSIPAYQTPIKIATRLSLSLELVEGILQSLKKMNLVMKNGSKWQFHSHDHHIPKSSPLVCLHHNSWR